MIKQKDFDSALRLTGKYSFNPVIQSQKMTIKMMKVELEKNEEIKKRYLEEAEETGEREEFINNPIIQNQLMTVKMKLGKLEEAEEIGEREEFTHNTIIQNKLEELLIKKYKDGEEIEGILNTEQVHTLVFYENQNPPILNKIAAKLYYDKIEEDDIEEVRNNNEISKFEKTVILLAIYEKKNNVSKAKQLIKQFKSEEPESEKNKTLNIIKQRIESKKIRIFDYGFYGELLKWNIDENLKEKFEQEKEEEKNHQRELRKKQKKTTETKSEQSNKSYGEVEINNDDYEKRRQNFRKRIEVKPNDRNSEISPKQIKEKTDYSNEIIRFLTKQKASIYVKLQSDNDEIQRNAITQWDKMGNLIEKVIANREDKEYIDKLYTKIQQLRGTER